MLARERKDIDRNVKAAAAKSSPAGVRSRRADERALALPVIDQDRLTIISLFIIMGLTALNVMLRFPELGAVIASYNQF